MMRYLAVCLFLTISACALDEPATDDPAPTELTRNPDQPIAVPPELQLQASGCVFAYPGTWGCYGDNWCNSKCTHAGDSQYGFVYECVKKPTHWETVCICCG